MMPTHKIAYRRTRVEMLENRLLLSVTFGSNLVLNPGAENYNGNADGYNIITPDHWTANGDPTVAQYDSGYGAIVGLRKPTNSGDAFFTGGPDSQSTDLFQTIDLSSIAGNIDAGQVNFSLSGQLGGNGFDGDNASVFVTFENAASSEVERLGTGSVSASDRNYNTELITRTTGGTIPATTRFAQVQIHFKRDSLTGYNNAFADNVSLVVVTNTASTAGITPTYVRSTVPATVVSGVRFSGAVVLRLTNNSTSYNRGLDTISLYASSNGVVDSTSIPLATIKRRINFGVGGSTLLAFPLRVLDIPAGSYTILAQTTDRYLTVDNATTGPAVTVAAPVVTLSASVGAVAPATVKPGRVISFVLTVQNSGNVNSTGLASFAIGLSADGTTTSATLRTQLTRLTIRSTGQPVRIRLRLKVPAAQTAGSYTPFVIFTQGTNSVTTIGTTPFTVA